MSRVERVIEHIDAANAADPTLLQGEPLALRQGILASVWLPKLASDASDVLQCAVRGHHLRRWELQRKDYPEGRSGYLRWRQENKKHQAESLAEILSSEGFSDEEVARSRYILLRKGLGKDPETQTVEDTACLVFIQTQFEEMLQRLDHDHMVKVVAKTLKKMSPEAISLTSQISLSEASKKVIAEAAAA